MNVSLTPELEAWIAERVASGRNRSSSEVVREALRLLQEEQERKAWRREELGAMIREGLADADAGRTVPMDRELLADIKRRGRARAHGWDR